MFYLVKRAIESRLDGDCLILNWCWVLFQLTSTSLLTELAFLTKRLTSFGISSSPSYYLSCLFGRSPVSLSAFLLSFLTICARAVVLPN